MGLGVEGRGGPLLPAVGMAGYGRGACAIAATMLDWIPRMREAIWAAALRMTFDCGPERARHVRGHGACAPAPGERDEGG